MKVNQFRFLIFYKCNLKTTVFPAFMFKISTDSFFDLSPFFRENNFRLYFHCVNKKNSLNKRSDKSTEIIV
jgi:hypothetical protein